MPNESDRDRGNAVRSPEDLAAEFLSRKSEGENPDPERFEAMLADEAARGEFRELVAGANQAERGLPRALSSGSLIAGRYRIREAIGSGGMGRVFSAFDEKLRREVAVKVLAPLAEGNRERRQMFEREWRTLADLKHPGIVAVHDAGNDGEFTYIVMDLVEGTAISDVIDRARRELERESAGAHASPRDGGLLSRAIGRGARPGHSELVDPLDWYRSVARVLLEIARTLEAAHEKRVVHRDLKPANVMLLGGGAPVVLDFGLAGSPEVSTGGVTEGLYGSVAYLAPEQAKSQKVGMDPRTDLYQVGLILYEMLTLRRAFPGAAIGEVLKRIEHGEYVSPRKHDPGVPADLEAICTMALELEPERRYPTAKALREDLELWLEGRTPVAARSAKWRSLVKSTRYAVRKHAVLASAAGMLAVGIGIYAWRKIAEPPSIPTQISFFKMNPTQGAGSLRAIENNDHVEPGDFLGFDLVKSERAVVYALSVYGTQGEGRYVYPWNATDSEHLDRLLGKDSGSKPWGWVVSKPKEQIVCVPIEADKDGNVINELEGLLVFVSEKPRPEFERWRQALMESQGANGIPYERALELLETGAPVTRGAPQRSWSLEEREILSQKLKLAQKKTTGKLGLPGVDDYRIECRVQKE